MNAKEKLDYIEARGYITTDEGTHSDGTMYVSLHLHRYATATQIIQVPDEMQFDLLRESALRSLYRLADVINSVRESTADAYEETEERPIEL